MCRRGDHNAADESKYFADASKDFADASKIFRRRIQGFADVSKIFRRHVQGFRRNIQKCHRRRGNAADATSYQLNY